jgi:hypothetical protein
VAQLINRNRNVDEIVGVDTNDYWLCQALSGHLFLPSGWLRRQRPDRPVTGRLGQAPDKSRSLAAPLL